MSNSAHEIARLMMLIEKHKEGFPNGLPVLYGPAGNVAFYARITCIDGGLKIVVTNSVWWNNTTSVSVVGDAHPDGSIKYISRLYEHAPFRWQLIELDRYE